MVEPPEITTEQGQGGVWGVNTTTTTIKHLIAQYAQVYGASEELSHQIAWCESRFNNVCNEKSCRYGIGIYQWTQSSFDAHCEGDPHNEEDNIQCAVKTIADGGIGHWGLPKNDPKAYHPEIGYWGSRECWGHLVE